MTRKYNLSHRLIACILLISLFLQSCGKFSKLTIPEVEGSIDVPLVASATIRNNVSEHGDQELTDYVTINPLVSQNLTPEAGSPHLISTFFSELPSSIRHECFNELYKNVLNMLRAME